MKVMDYILEKIKNETLHMGLIDPDEQKPTKSGEIALTLDEVGSDAIMVGGSTGVTQKLLDDTVKAIKNNTELPVILFPSRAKAISPYVDAIYFMSMLNSRDLNKVIGEQVNGAPLIKKLGIEPLSMGYIIIEPGMTVGEVGEADLIPRDNPEVAISYGLAAKYLGMELLYMEAGSGAPQPIPTNLVKAVKEEVGLPLVVGGGIRTEEQARLIAKAGADIIVTGTVIEKTSQLRDEMEMIINAMKEI